MELTEERVEFLRRYLDLLDTIEEGFAYIEDQLVNELHDHVDRMINDIALAFLQIKESNEFLQEIFVDNSKVKDTIEQFNQLDANMKYLEDLMNHPKEKSTYLLEEMIPFFNKWKENVAYYLTNEISH